MEKQDGSREDAKILVRGVISYVQGRHGVRVSRQTIYNWIHRGVRGVRLRSEVTDGFRSTTTPWVDEFLEALSRQSPLP